MEIFKRVMACAERHNLPVAAVQVAEFEGQERPDLQVMLQKLFPTIATGHLAEQGCSPEDFYPGLFDSYCALTGGAFAPQDVEFASADDWDSFELHFTWQGQTQALQVPDIDGSDWYSPSMLEAMNEFAEEHLAGRWLVVLGEDDWCVVLYLPAEAHEELSEVVEAWRESLYEE